MTERSVPSMAGVPAFFADQPAAIQLGAHVCKLTFGASDPDDAHYPRPIVTVVMQTTTLLTLVNDLKSKLEAESFKKVVTERYRKDAARIAAGDAKTQPGGLIETKKLSKARGGKAPSAG